MNFERVRRYSATVPVKTTKTGGGATVVVEAGVAMQGACGAEVAKAVT